jgi:hypothetical protein
LEGLEGLDFSKSFDVLFKIDCLKLDINSFSLSISFAKQNTETIKNR